MNNNHIGTAFEVMKDIADLEGWNYSHGTLTEFDFKAFLVFPLMHCSIQSVALTDQVFSKGLWRTEQDYFNQIQYIRPITFQPFMETLDSVLAGYQITVGIELINPWVTDGDCV